MGFGINDSIGQGTTVPPYTPQSIDLARRPEVLWVNGIGVNPQAFSSTYSAGNASNAWATQLQVATLRQARAYLLGGPLHAQRRAPLGAYRFLTEPILGVPLMVPFDQGEFAPGGWTGWGAGNDTPTQLSWARQRADDPRRVGLGWILDKPGGVAGYFTRWVRPNLHHYVAQFMLGEQISQTGWWESGSTPSFQLSTEQLAAARALGPQCILANFESVFPYSSPVFLQPSNDNYPIGSYLAGFRLAMIERDGVAPSDAALRDEYLSTLLQYLRLVCGELRRIFPGCWLAAYEWPCGRPFNVVAPTNPYGEAMSAEEDGGVAQLDQVWDCFDFTGSGVGYQPYEVIDDAQTPGSSSWAAAGQVRYSSAYWTQQLLIQRHQRLRERLTARGSRCRIGVTVRASHLGLDVASDLTHTFNAHAISECRPDLVINWESPGFELHSRLWGGSAWGMTYQHPILGSTLATLTLEQELAQLQSSSARLMLRLEGFLRDQRATWPSGT
jgi:hypothetical protein